MLASEQNEAAALWKGWSLSNQRFEEPAGKTHRLVVRNEFGDVNVRMGPTATTMAQISAVHQRQDQDPFQLIVGARPEGDALLIEVRLEADAARTQPGGDPAAARNLKRRSDVTVFIPAGMALEVVAAGKISTRKLSCDVDLTSHGGEVQVDTSGRPRVKAKNGRVWGVLRGSAWSEPATIETVSGDIELFFLPEADVAVEASSMGLITTDFSLSIDRKPGSRHKTGRAQLGAGKARLTIRSEVGQILLLLNV